MTIIINNGTGQIIEETCQIPTCTAPAKYAIFWTQDGVKTWVHVCEMHDQAIGYQNEERYDENIEP